MSALGYDFSEENIRKILEEVDADGSGVIEIDEFVPTICFREQNGQNYLDRSCG